MYKIYEEYLDREFSPDYWSDEGISQAVLVLMKFDEDDWEILAKSRESRPDLWILRCAETLGDIANEKALLVLLGFLQLESDEIRVATLGSIRSLISSGMEISNHRDEILSAINKIKETEKSEPIVDLMLNSLEAKLLPK